MRVRNFHIAVFLLCVFASKSFGVWNKVGQFSTAAGCGYFFDADNGMIGLGQFGFAGRNFIGNSPLAIYWTSNGGTTWNASAIPPGGMGRITDISMMDRTTGYAAVFSDSYSLWKTTDGGKSWMDFSQGNTDLLTCVYATTKAITRTIWAGNLGGSSTDGGRTFSQVFSGGISESNGIDFADDNIGVATMGPGQFFRTTSWFTTNGGVSWNQGSDLPESWSVYALKGTKTFFTCSEDEGSLSPPGHTIYWSQDGGNTWQPKFSFPSDPGFTGHIAGVGNTIYVQTNTNTQHGLFRSDDLGAMWVNVGGPSNTRDSRFAVTGCRGEVVYAFDDEGGIWKTTDGGDGAFSFTPRIGDIASVKAGDTTLIPIYLDSTAAAFSIDQFSGNLTLNRDLLNPFGFQTRGTLSAGANFDTLYSLPDSSINFLVKYSTPLKNGIPLSKPIIYIKAAAYLTRTDTTTVTLNSLTMNSGALVTSLMVCSAITGSFTLQYECADTTIRQLLVSGSVPQLLRIAPNPSSMGSVGIEVYLPQETELSVELTGINGLFAKNQSFGRFETGVQKLLLNTAGISSGEYFLKIHSGNGSYLSGRVVITR